MVITMNRFLFYQASQGITGAFHMIIMMFYTTIKQAQIFQLYHKLSCNLATCKHHLKSLITDAPAAHYSVYDQTSLSLSLSFPLLQIQYKKIRGGNNRGKSQLWKNLSNITQQPSRAEARSLTKSLTCVFIQDYQNSNECCFSLSALKIF